MRSAHRRSRRAQPAPPPPPQTFANKFAPTRADSPRARRIISRKKAQRFVRLRRRPHRAYRRTGEAIRRRCPLVFFVAVKIRPPSPSGFRVLSRVSRAKSSPIAPGGAQPPPSQAPAPLRLFAATPLRPSVPSEILPCIPCVPRATSGFRGLSRLSRAPFRSYISFASLRRAHQRQRHRARHRLHPQDFSARRRRPEYPRHNHAAEEKHLHRIPVRPGVKSPD